MFFPVLQNYLERLYQTLQSGTDVCLDAAGRARTLLQFDVDQRVSVDTLAQRLLAAVDGNHGSAFRRVLSALELSHDRIVLQLPLIPQRLAAELCVGQLPTQRLRTTWPAHCRWRLPAYWAALW